MYGDRIGRCGRLAVGCSASIFDPDSERLLLIRRADNGRWAVPGGYMEPGESAAEACAREVWEETGRRVVVTRLIGVYTTPHRLVEYADGNRYQLVVLHFAAELIDAEAEELDDASPGPGAETVETGYFTPAEIQSLELGELDRARITDTLANRLGAFVR